MEAFKTLKEEIRSTLLHAIEENIPQIVDIDASDGTIVIYEALYFDVAQGRLNGAPNETRTHSCRFASQAC